MSLRNIKTVEICKDLKPYSTQNVSKLNGIFETIMKNIASKYNLPIGEVRLAVNSVFKFTNILLHKSIEEPYSKDKFVKIRWIYLGSFQISKFRVNNFFKKRELDNADNR